MRSLLCFAHCKRAVTERKKGAGSLQLTNQQDSTCALQLRTADCLLFCLSRVVSSGLPCQGRATNLLIFVPVGSVALLGSDIDSSAADDCPHALEQIRLQAVWLGDVSHNQLQASPWSCPNAALHRTHSRLGQKIQQCRILYAVVDIDCMDYRGI